MNPQFLLTDAAGPTSAVSQGADQVFVGSALNKFPFSLYTQKEITRPADLAAQRSTVPRPDLTVEKFVDNTIVDQLEREGFFRSIGAAKQTKQTRFLHCVVIGCRACN